jgi:translational activator of cytochrome c oxidase 1
VDLRREISDGGSIDPEKNVALFNVLKKARAGGVPKANIESALQKVRLFFSSKI